MPPDDRPRAPRVPLLDTLGKLCVEGRDAAAYLWQVPTDAAARERIVGILEQIATEAAQQNRREMGRIVEELMPAARATPSPQQVDLLVAGFDRLFKLWQAARSGLM
jgi:uncharacterized membrane protein YccC